MTQETLDVKNGDRRAFALFDNANWNLIDFDDLRSGNVFRLQDDFSKWVADKDGNTVFVADGNPVDGVILCHGYVRPVIRKANETAGKIAAADKKRK